VTGATLIQQARSTDAQLAVSAAKVAGPADGQARKSQLRRSSVTWATCAPRSAQAPVVRDYLE
jgi:hypothetical protein